MLKNDPINYRLTFDEKYKAGIEKIDSAYVRHVLSLMCSEFGIIDKRLGEIETAAKEEKIPLIEPVDTSEQKERSFIELAYEFLSHHHNGDGETCLALSTKLQQKAFDELKSIHFRPLKAKDILVLQSLDLETRGFSTTERRLVVCASHIRDEQNSYSAICYGINYLLSVFSHNLLAASRVCDVYVPENVQVPQTVYTLYLLDSVSRPRP